MLRYDKRGVGQSGGRAEAATLADYAEDAARGREVHERAERRRPQAHRGRRPQRGRAVAMLAAARENRIAALALVATPGVTGAELNSDQVTRALERSNRPEAEQTGDDRAAEEDSAGGPDRKGWEDRLPAAVRRQADTPWFQSFLAFDPGKSHAGRQAAGADRPGELDTQVAPAQRRPP